MKTIIKILLILAVSFIVLGGIIFTVGMFANGWDFTSMSNVYYENKTYENSASNIDNIVVDVDTENVEFLLVDSDKITVEYSNALNKKGNFISEIIPKIDGNTLSLKEFDKKFSLTFSFLSNKRNVVVKIPQNKVFSIKVETSTGDVIIGEQNKETTYSKIDVETTTGRFKVLGKINCLDSFIAELDTGSIISNGEINCDNLVEFEVDTGKITLNSKLNAKRVKFQSDTGKITLNEVVANAITLKVSTGDIVCESPILASDIEIIASTGDVKLILKGAKADYSYYYDISTGRSNISPYISGSNVVRVKTTTGDVDVYFKE